MGTSEVMAIESIRKRDLWTRSMPRESYESVARTDTQPQASQWGFDAERDRLELLFEIDRLSAELTQTRKERDKVGDQLIEMVGQRDSARAEVQSLREEGEKLRSAHFDERCLLPDVIKKREEEAQTACNGGIRFGSESDRLRAKLAECRPVVEAVKKTRTLFMEWVSMLPSEKRERKWHEFLCARRDLCQSIEDAPFPLPLPDLEGGE